MSGLLGQVVRMGLAAAMSPVIFLLQLNTLIGPRALPRGSALTSGAAVVLVAPSASEASPPSSSSSSR